jgi:hypothetical protein
MECCSLSVKFRQHFGYNWRAGVLCNPVMCSMSIGSFTQLEQQSWIVPNLMFEVLLRRMVNERGVH